MMLQGLPVEPNPRENLAEHFLQHLWDIRNVEQGGNVAPQFLVMAQDHTRKTQILLSAILTKPEAFVDDVGKEQVLKSMAPKGVTAAGSAPGAPGAPAIGPSMDSSLPPMGQKVAGRAL